MQERDRYHLALVVAETMYNLWGLEYQQDGLDLDALMTRLKDLSAYALDHADIQDRRQGVELLALGMLFGATSDPRYQGNQERLALLSEEIIAYAGQAEAIEQEIAAQGARRAQAQGENKPEPPQPPLF